ncbi:MAG TPA: hypothetical protein VNY52_06610 [Solirubrobacteraceae bacterium]|jgi:hypothetical protein|nr:hypothetical protein [Solirubrobacteraceae bacterium]
MFKLTPVLTLAVCLSIVGLAAAKPSASKPFEIEPGSFHLTPSTDQAGAHEDLTTTLDFKHNALGQTFNDVKDVVVELPVGFVGNNTAVPTCDQAQLTGALLLPGKKPLTECPPASQVGQITIELAFNGLRKVTVPVYNMEVNSFGIVAELGFKTLAVTQIMPITVRPEDSGLTVTTPNIEKAAEAHGVSVTIWGLPSAKIHNAQRGRECVSPAEPGFPECMFGGEEVNIPVEPFLANATSCGPFTARLKVDAWEDPGAWSEAESAVGPIGECERVHFDPSLVASPTTNTAESSSGLNVSLVVPQTWENPYSIATSHLKDTVLTLPVGYTVNPSAGSGLGACTPQQFAVETSSSLPGEGCPAESKIGSVEVETPVLTEKLTGAIYVAKPFDNPFDSLLGLYIVVKDPFRGIVVKLAGRIEPNPVTGQLVTRFDDNPQVPFSKFTLKLRQGVTSPLVSPPACGAYTATADFTPWSAPLIPQLQYGSLRIEKGIGGGPCPPGGIPPFHPGIIAGTLNDSAGAYSPMDIRITRNDGEQEITRFTSILPAGLTAKLTGVPFCSDADIEAAKHVTGAQEETEPSCPKASEIGHSLVGAGVGSVLAYTPGKVYMAGPYNGAPFSIAAITSAKVGPFDLGTVVVREALVINPETAVVTVDAKASDPIPHIIDGIVIHVRDIRIYIDRPQFMINPTNCDPASFAATVDGAGADFTNPADQVPVTVTNPFQMANCQNLQFKPTFKVSTSGRPSRLDGESLSVKLSYPNAPQGTQTNIKLVKVELPKQLPSRLPTLQKACPEKTFLANPALCPAASVIGHATASTPILPVPLTGPAYFVSYGGAKFPELIIVLQGYGVTLDLHGETFISKAGITSSTFRTVPDDPIGSFELTLPQGPFSALAANGNPCKGTLTMPTEFLAQNGDAIHEQTKVAVSGCPKHKDRAKKKARKASRRGRRSQGRGARTERR